MYGTDANLLKRYNFNDLDSIATDIYMGLSKTDGISADCDFDVPFFYHEHNLLINNHDALIYTDPYGNDKYCEFSVNGIKQAILHINQMI